MSFIIQVKSAAGSWATNAGVGDLIADMGFNYSDKLNAVNEANINLSATGETKRALIEMGSEVKIWRNDGLEFHGLVNTIDYLEGGGVSINAKGFEWWLGLENGAYAGSPWSATASATIFSAVIGESNYFSAGTVNAGTSVDYRASVTDSIWNVLADLKEATSQDIGIDYANSEIDILDHKGSSTSVKTFNAGIQIGDVRIGQSYPLANKVLVYGKSEGETRITSEYPGHGYDATSQSTYGIITKIIRDPKILTVAQANILADADVARLKDPIKVYDFDVMNTNQALVSGDVITLNAKSQGVSNEEVRIVGIERGEKGGGEYLMLQVTNAAYSKLTKGVDEVIANIDKTFRDQQTYESYDDEYANQNVDTTLGGFMTTDLTGAQLNNVRQVASTVALTLGTASGYILYLIPSSGNLGADVQVWGHLDMYTNKIKNLATPTANYDGATKKYVDDNIGGGGFKAGQYTHGSITNVNESWQTLATVIMTVNSDEAAFLSYSCSIDADTSSEDFEFRFTRSGTTLYPSRDLEPDSTGGESQAHIQLLDAPGSTSSYTYRLQCRTGDGTGDCFDGVFDVLVG